MAAEKWADKHLLLEGDLLFARSGATVGKTYLHDVRFDPAVFAGYCIRFRFNDKVLPEFVYGFTKTDAYASWVGAIQRPAGQPNINKEEFKSLEIPLPPLDIQRSLVAELDAARALAEASALNGRINEFLFETLRLERPQKIERSIFAVRLGELGKRIDAYSNQPRFRNLFKHLLGSAYTVATFDSVSERIFQEPPLWQKAMPMYLLPMVYVSLGAVKSRPMEKFCRLVKYTCIKTFIMAQ